MVVWCVVACVVACVWRARLRLSFQMDVGLSPHMSQVLYRADASTALRYAWRMAGVFVAIG